MKAIVAFISYILAKKVGLFLKGCRKYLSFGFLCSEENEHLSGMAVCFVGVGCYRLGFYVFLLTNAEKAGQNENKG